jgi:hypothetical protein
LEAYGVPADAPIDMRTVYGKNPNLLGPKGQPWEQLDTLDSEGNLITVDHHANGHFFTDNNTWSLPHYHGPNGEHFFYGDMRAGYVR